MTMSILWGLLIFCSVGFSLWNGTGPALSAAVAQGAQSGLTLAISIGGSLCLWSGVGRLMEAVGATKALSRLLRPLLGQLFPESRRDAFLSGALSGNICANLLGLGNAATPMGIAAAKRLIDPARPKVAGDSLCRLIVLNTASIQLIPANVAAIRASLGCQRPFDILYAVWATSFASAGAGLLMAWILGKVWKDA